jgi:hypothetical protein
MTKAQMFKKMFENMSIENKDHPQHTKDFYFEEKKSIRQNFEEENLSEFELCRKYNKTRSMAQD